MARKTAFGLSKLWEELVVLNTRRRRAKRFALQLYVTHIALVTAVVGIVLGGAVVRQASQVRDQAAANIQQLASTAVLLPSLREGLEATDPTTEVQPLVELLGHSGQVDYVTVVGMDGVRIAHTNPDLVGLPVSSDHSAVRAGEVFEGTEVGPTGRTFRVKMPIRDESGAIRATLSLGVAEERLYRDTRERSIGLLVLGLPALLLGLLVSWWTTRWLLRSFYNVEPAHMGVLLLAREAITEGLSDGFVAIDADARVALANPASTELLGAPIELGTPVEGLPRQLAEIVAASHSGGPGVSYHQVVLGGRRLVVTSSTTFVAGRLLGTTLLLQDRTRLDEALQELDSQAVRLATMRRDAHEFDNRLHVLSGLLGLGRYDEASAFLEAEQARGDEQPGKLGGIRQPRVAALLHSRMMSARLGGTTITVAEDCDVPEDAPHADYLTLVLGNLLANSVEAGATAVTVYLQADEVGCALVVEDNGPGVPPQHAATVFDEGWSTKGESAERGVGLALVRSRTEALGGSIRMGESPSGGASVEVFVEQWRDLPAGPAQEGDEQ